MGNADNKEKILRSRSLSNTLYIVVRREAQGRVKDNYSSAIAGDYSMSQGSASDNLNTLENASVLERKKDGRRYIFSVNWSNFSDLLYDSPGPIRYFQMPEEELYEMEMPEEDEYETLGGLYEEFLENLENLTGKDEFEEFLKEFFLKYSKNIDIEKTETGHFVAPPLKKVLQIQVTALSDSSNLLKNQVEAIAETSDITEEKAIESLRVEKDKKELLSELRSIWYQHNYVDTDVLLDQEELVSRIAYDVFEDYFGIYSKNPISIESDLLDRLP